MINRRTRHHAACILLLAVIAGASLTSAQAQLSRTPAVGSAERKAILDVLRARSERDLKQKVIFEVTLLKVSGDWAAARVTPMRPEGGAIDYSKTSYKELVAEGVFDGEGEALLQRKSGNWALVKWRFGASDTELSMWIEELGAPKSLNQAD